jgi:hypothetical protein
MHFSTLITTLLTLSSPAVSALPSVEETVAHQLVPPRCPGGASVPKVVCPEGRLGVSTFLPDCHHCCQMQRADPMHSAYRIILVAMHAPARTVARAAS